MSTNLDILRSLAVIYVISFHLLKFFLGGLSLESQHRLETVGSLGVYIFFVHTTIVLMQSLERHGANWFKFMVRRCFRIYPLSIVLVTIVWLFQIPQSENFGYFFWPGEGLRGYISNLLLIQDFTRNWSMPGVLWTLPLEMQMYLVLPLFFLLAKRAANSLQLIAFWIVYTVGVFFFYLVLPSTYQINLPLRGFMYVPCFFPGVIAYKLIHQERRIGAQWWPLCLIGLSVVFACVAPSSPWIARWCICLVIGLLIPAFKEFGEGIISQISLQIAKYSYGLYLTHSLAIWFAFQRLAVIPLWSRVVVFITLLMVLPVLLYSIVEAPMIQAGRRLTSPKRVEASASVSLIEPGAEPALVGSGHGDLCS